MEDTCSSYVPFVWEQVPGKPSISTWEELDKIKEVMPSHLSSPSSLQLPPKLFLPKHEFPQCGTTSTHLQCSKSKNPHTPTPTPTNSRVIACRDHLQTRSMHHLGSPGQHQSKYWFQVSLRDPKLKKLCKSMLRNAWRHSLHFLHHGRQHVFDHQQQGKEPNNGTVNRSFNTISQAFPIATSLVDHPISIRSHEHEMPSSYCSWEFLKSTSISSSSSSCSSSSSTWRYLNSSNPCQVPSESHGLKSTMEGLPIEKPSSANPRECYVHLDGSQCPLGAMVSGHFGSFKEETHIKGDMQQSSIEIYSKRELFNMHEHCFRYDVWTRNEESHERETQSKKPTTTTKTNCTKRPNLLAPQKMKTKQEVNLNKDSHDIHNMLHCFSVKSSIAFPMMSKFNANYNCYRSERGNTIQRSVREVKCEQAPISSWILELGPKEDETNRKKKTHHPPANLKKLKGIVIKKIAKPSKRGKSSNNGVEIWSPTLASYYMSSQGHQQEEEEMASRMQK